MSGLYLLVDSLCSSTILFVSCLFGNLENNFCCDEAHIYYQNQEIILVWNSPVSLIYRIIQTICNILLEDLHGRKNIVSCLSKCLLENLIDKSVCQLQLAVTHLIIILLDW